MPDWSAGYVADIGYTYGTYAELNPHRTRLAFLAAGLIPPKVATACELGFGQGMSINVHAAASGVQWHGTDFNPSQAAFAQDLAAASGADVHLYDQSFEEFCGRADLPDFDFIGLHGIFSWISDENRHVIVDFVRRKLKVGGVLYISYNTQPGWAAMAPVRELLSEHANVMGVPGGGSAARVDASVAFVERVFATNPRFVKANPQIAARFDKVKAMSRNYLAHEYFNRDWMPFPFSRLSRLLEPAKLSFACSAHHLDQVEAINITAEQRELLSGIADPLFAQTVLDYMTNQSFRRDYWVKGPRKLGNSERDEQMLQLRVLLLTERAEVPTTVNGALGELTLQQQVYEPLLDLLADQMPHSVGELVEIATSRHGLTPPHVLQAVLILAGAGHVATLQDDAAIEQATPAAQRLNARVCELAVSRQELHYLAAPATGGALSVDRIQLLFLLARSRGANDAEQWAAFAHDVLVRQGQRLVHDGKPMADDLQRNELVRLAVHLRDHRLPLLRRLGAVA
jgi:SAM-dependent methyltransferase